VSYLRFSTPLRDGCGECFPDPEMATFTDELPGLKPARYVADPEGYRGRSLCPRCSSCWYVWDDITDCVRAMHHGCAADPVNLTLSYEEAAQWSAPAACQFAAEATKAVCAAGREAVRETLLDAECYCCGDEFEIGVHDGDEADCHGCGRRWMTSVNEDAPSSLIAVDEDAPCRCSPCLGCERRSDRTDEHTCVRSEP